MSLRLLPGGRVEPPPPEPEWLTLPDGQRVRVPLDLENPLARQLLTQRVRRMFSEHPTLYRNVVLRPLILDCLRIRLAALEGADMAMGGDASEPGA